MSAALAHVFRNVDSAAQWEKAVCGLASMSHLERAQAQLHLLRTFSRPSDSWARLAVVESQCQFVLQQALADLEGRRQGAERVAPQHEPGSISEYATPVSLTPESTPTRPVDLTGLRELIAKMKAKGQRSEEALAKLMGTPRNLHQPLPSEPSAVDIHSDEFALLHTRVRNNFSNLIKRGSETPLDMTKRLYLRPGFDRLLRLETDVEFIRAANSESEIQYQPVANVVIENQIRKIHSTLSQFPHAGGDLERLTRFHSIEELAAAGPEEMKKMIAALPPLAEPMSPQQHASRPVSAKTRTDKQMLANQEESSESESPLSSRSSRAGSVVSSVGSVRGGGEVFASPRYV